MPTTVEIQTDAIAKARDKNWMVLSAGTDYTAIVIAHCRDMNTNWYREMVIVDGVAETMTHQSPDTVWNDEEIAKKLECFKLDTQGNDFVTTETD